MRIGLVIAVARELKSFLESSYQVEVIKEDYREVYKTSVNNNEIFAVKSGCGLIDASNATQYLITKYACDVILNFGVTGALVRELKVEDLLIVEGACNCDFDVSPIDPVAKHQYEEFDDIFMPLDKDLISLAKQIRPDLKEAKCASGDRFVCDIDDKMALASLGASIYDMEIAGIVRTCWTNRVKCLSIKCISDTFDGDGGDFEANVISSANKAFKILDEIFKEL